jgi:hypothetical protein
MWRFSSSFDADKGPSPAQMSQEPTGSIRAARPKRPSSEHVTGLYVTYYGYFEIRLYFTNASPDDPVIQAAAVVQGFLVRLVDTIGVWPLLGALATLVAVTIGSRALARLRADR